MIPKLKIVPISAIIPAMDFIPETCRRFQEMIESTGIIATPVSLIEYDESRYLLLDDSAILQAAENLGIGFLPAQLAEPNQIAGIKAEILIDDFDVTLLDKFSGTFPRAAKVCSCKKELRKQSESVYLVFSQGGRKDINICFRCSDSDFLPGSLFDFLDLLGRNTKLIRKIVSKKIKASNIKANQKHWSVRLPNLTLNRIISSVAVNRLFPPGFIRFDFGSRVIGVEYPVSILNEKASIREKERFLYDLVNFRINNGFTEYIEGGVYLLNYLAKK